MSSHLSASRIIQHLAITIFLTTVASAVTNIGTASDADDAFFDDKVRPILEQRCWDCHGEDVQESGLRLDSRKNLMAGGSSGHTMAVEGKPAESSLIEVIRHEGDVVMPPDDKLPDVEIDTLAEWVRRGLPWPLEGGDATASPKTKEEHYASQLEEHWAFHPIVAPEIPPVQQTEWVSQPIDRFVLSHLEQNNLRPSEEADRYTLIRRLKYDLLGLPPTRDEVDAFLQDDGPDAYAKLVDRFLTSPHYGERWGRHWLDVARYADTRGYAFGRERRYPYAYTYRDYVIQALNEDMPFDQFVMEQMAADLLFTEANDPRLAALGFLTVGRKYNNRHLDIDDQIDVVGRGLLGLTLACARCHDHKYDPIPTEDYYSLYGVFASSSEPGDFPVIGDPHQVPGYDEFKKELDSRKSDLESYKKKTRDELVQSARQHAVDYLARAITREPEKKLQELPFIALKGEEFRPKLVQRWRTILAKTAKADHPVLGPMFDLALIPDQEYPDKAPAILEKWKSVPVGTDKGQLNPLVKELVENEPADTKLLLAKAYGQLFSSVFTASQSDPGKEKQEASLENASQQVLDVLVGPGSLTDISVEQISGLLTRAEGNKYRELERKIQAYQVDAPGAPPRAMVVKESPQPHNPRVFIRGNQRRPGKTVPRQSLLAVSGLDRQPFKQGSGRLELTQQIVSPDNPLTARVLANRIWMHHFGSPLVATPSDFGTRSAAPQQSDTLDYLASLLLSNNWSLKSLHRTILLSSTYRQSSLRRSDCENVDPENMLYWRMNRRRLEFEAMRDTLLAVSGQLDTTMGGRPEEMTKEPFSCRRAIYGFIDRQDLPGLFRVFDLASPDQSCPRRSMTTVPQQALFLMNSPFVIERAKGIAARSEVVQSKTVDQRIDAIYSIVFARSPCREELEIGRQFLQASGATSSQDKGESQPEITIIEQYAQLLTMSNSFMFVD